MSTSGSGAVEEMLGSSSPYICLKGKELKRAEQRYESVPKKWELVLVKMALSPFIGEGKAYTGPSVTSSELIADPQILSWGTRTETDCEQEHSIGLKRQ